MHSVFQRLPSEPSVVVSSVSLVCCRWCAGVEAALQAMQRQQEAVAYCPTSQLRGGSLVPDPPGQEASTSGRAAEDYAEFKLQLLEFSQVGALALWSLHDLADHSDSHCPA